MTTRMAAREPLERMLLDLPAGADPMVFSELDGFLAGICLSPEPITPKRWLPEIWGRTDARGERFCHSKLAETDRLIHHLMQRYEQVSDALQGRAQGYVPVFEHELQAGATIWELWAQGFGRAVDLAPEAWSRLPQSEHPVLADAARGLLELVAVSRGGGYPGNADAHAFDDRAPAEIRHWAESLARAKHWD